MAFSCTRGTNAPGRVRSAWWAFPIAIGMLFCTFAVPAVADVEVWTDKEKRILKGDLKGLRILPSGSGAKTQARPQKKTKKRGRKQAKPSRGPMTLRVGPKERLKWPSLAAAEAQDGDTIEITAGEYVDCANWKANNLTIRGVGGRAHVRDEMCQGKAIWIINGINTTIENIEFSGMKVKDKNGAGIRHQGAGLTIRNSYFHDGEQGILGGGQKPGDTILIEDSEFARIGKIGRAHPIYINRSKKFTLRRSYIHDCVDESNCVKSRADHSVISCNVIASLEGNSSWEIDLPNGGLGEIRNNTIQQGPKSANRNIIGFAMETSKPRKRYPQQKLIIESNIVINDHSSGKFVNIRRRENTELQIKGNTFIGPGKLDYKEGNEHFHRRHTAKMKPYPFLPPACKK